MPGQLFHEKMVKFPIVRLDDASLMNGPMAVYKI